MRVLVVGSMRENVDNDLDPVKNEEEFKSVCQVLGKKLAESSDEVIVCSESPNTADPYIIKGVVEGGGTTVKVFYPNSQTDDGNPKPYASGKDEYAGVKFDHVPIEGGWRFTHLAALREADVIFAIGGSTRGTYNVIYSAEVLEKPVLLTPVFGGAAKEAFRDFKYYYDQIDIYTELLQGVDGNKIHAFLDRLYRKNPFQKEKTTSTILRAVFGVAAFLVWFFLFWEPFQWVEPHVAVLLMIGSSAIAGGILRNTLRLVGAIQTRWDANLLIELLLGLLLSFGVFLIPQMVGLLLNAEAATLETVEDVRRVGGGLSLISFLGALFLEDAYRRLDRKRKSVFRQ
jgi:hypothetical protein